MWNTAKSFDDDSFSSSAHFPSLLPENCRRLSAAIIALKPKIVSISSKKNFFLHSSLDSIRARAQEGRKDKNETRKLSCLSLNDNFQTIHIRIPLLSWALLGGVRNWINIIRTDSRAPWSRRRRWGNQRWYRIHRDSQRQRTNDGDIVRDSPLCARGRNEIYSRIKKTNDPSCRKEICRE